jgi:hypothetical protein
MNITEEGLWRMELNTRMFTLPKKNQKGGRNENVESGRRYDLSLKGLAEELHLKSDEIQIAGSTLLACDISTEANTIFSLLLKTKIGNEHGVKDDEPQDLVINSGPQEIRFVDLKGSEIIELIKRGVIRDEATISMVAAFLSKYTKEISFKEEFASKVLYMKEVIAPHDGGKKKRLTMLNGSINSGEQVSIFQQNSGTWRSDYTVNNSTLKEYKQNRKSNERIVAKNMKELFEGFGLGKYDLTTTAAVFVGMLQADMIDINEIDLKNWPPKTAVPDIP